MFTLEITQRGTIFHQYTIVYDKKNVYTFRADQKEAQAIQNLFELVRASAVNTSDPFPFAVVRSDQTAVLCGPKKSDLNWGPVLEGPATMLNDLLPALINVFYETQTKPPSVSAKKSGPLSGL